jgi:hypothetical protein
MLSQLAVIVLMKNNRENEMIRALLILVRLGDEAFSNRLISLFNEPHKEMIDYLVNMDFLI